MESLTAQEQAKLKEILSKSSQLQTADNRIDFITSCGLHIYLKSIQIDKIFDIFFTSLMAVFCTKVIKTENGEEKLALVIFLEYFIQLETTLSTEDKDSIEHFIQKCQVKPRKNGNCPYRGLSAFTEDDKHLFFGRETFVERLFKTVQEKSLVAVTGSSGSGKSSVVFAGLFPKLKQEGNWRYISFRPCSPNTNPFSNLVIALEKVGLEVGKRTTKEIIENLQSKQEDLSNEIGRILWNNSDQHLLLFIDQFEELYKQDINQKEQAIFIEQILNAIKNTKKLTIVFTIRADFWAYVLSDRDLTDAIQDANVPLAPMNRIELQDAIEKPAHSQGVQIEARLTDQMLNTVEGKPGNLPLVEFALTQLWEEQSEGKLTNEAYQKIGGVENALAKHAQEQYDALNKSEQRKVQQIFIQLVYPGQGTEDTRRLATRSEVGTDNWDVVAKLADARLVVTGSRTLEATLTADFQESNSASEETVEVIHETLITKWKVLKEWIDGDRTFRTWQERLRSSMRQWKNSKNDRGALLRGSLLEEAKEKLDTHLNYLSDDEKDYIERSLSYKRQKEVISFLFLVGSATLFAISYLSFSQAKEAQDGTKLEQQSNSVIRQFPNNQIQALVETIQIGKELEKNVTDRQIKDYPTIRPISVLQEILDNIHEKNKFDTGHEIVTSISFSPDSQSIATVGKDGKLRLWNLSGQIIKEIQAHDGKISGANSVTFSPDGKRIATSGEDQKVKFFDAVSGELSKTLSEKESGIKSASFSPDGKKIATSGYYGIARIWDLSGKQLPITLKGYKESDKITSITFSSDRKTIATAADDGTVRLWDLSAGKELSKITPHKGKAVLSVRFSPDGKLFATAGEDKSPRIWNLSGQEQRKLEGHNELVSFVDFSPDGKQLVTTSDDGTAKVWDAASGKEIYNFQGHERSVLTASFSPDSKYLATAGKDGKTRIWNLSDQQTTQTTEFKGHQSDVNTLSISHDGTRMASGDNNGFVRLWDLSTNKQIGKEFKADNRGRVLSITFSPDSKFLISGGEDGIAKIWDLSGQLVRPLKEKQGNYFISSLSFSSDGKYIAITGSNQTPKIWSWDGEKIAQKIATLEGHKDLVYQVSFHPKQELIATGAWDGTIGLWKLSDNKVNKIKIWSGDQGKIRSLSFSSDGKYLATADDNSQLKVWDLSGQEKLKLFSYQREIQAVAFSSDGKYIATGGKDGTVKLWDWLGRQVFEFKIEKGSVWDISFSADGRSIVAGGDSGQLQSWAVKDLDQLLAEGCDWLKGYLENSGQAKDKLKVCRNKDSNPK
ncbi:nSTAND1 domain-containing NTPase [Microcoleus sp. herbarium12]|uniref:nSTAND1 domain-containing NTPase n=1 Tax=Microcoleus sp. herbarium12 TaxID=3055437 RepID=UPI002FD4A721